MKKKISLLILIFILSFSISNFLRKKKLTSFRNKTKLIFNFYNFDFGELHLNDTAKVYFTYKNSEKNSLLIEKITTTCGCTIARWSEIKLLYLQKDSILIEYDTSKKGYFTKEIMVFSNSKTSPDHLFIKGRVISDGKKIKTH